MIIVGLLILAIKFWVIKSAWNYYREWLDERSEEAQQQVQLEQDAR